MYKVAFIFTLCKIGKGSQAGIRTRDAQSATALYYTLYYIIHTKLYIIFNSQKYATVYYM